MDDGQLAVAPRQRLATRFNDAMLPDEGCHIGPTIMWNRESGQGLDLVWKLINYKRAETFGRVTEGRNIHAAIFLGTLRGAEQDPMSIIFLRS